MYIVLATCKFHYTVVFLLERVKRVIYIVLNLPMEIEASSYKRNLSRHGPDLHMHQN